MKAKIEPLGDSALLVHLGEAIDPAVNARVHALDARLSAGPHAQALETVPAFATLLIHYDPLAVRYSDIRDWIHAALEEIQSTPPTLGRLREIPVRYGGELGPDLAWVAAHQGLSTAEVVHMHTSQTYTVYMMGFTPGFPYLGKLPRALVAPRLESPRLRVPAGSVGIAGEQTGIYPIDSPGGWRLIGWTALQLLDPSGVEPFLLAPGDEVRFRAESVDA